MPVALIMKDIKGMDLEGRRGEDEDKGQQAKQTVLPKVLRKLMQGQFKACLDCRARPEAA